MSIELENINDSSGNGNKGSAKFPTVVTSSGSSLPSASGYQLNDTFLNTSDKKIYKTTADSYELNTNASLQKGTTSSGTPQDATIDYYTGILSNANLYTQSYGQTTYWWRYAYRQNIENLRWQGDKTYRFHIKLNSAPTDDKVYHFVYLGNPVSSSYTTVFTNIYIGVKNKKLYIGASNIGSYGLSNIVPHTLLCDYELEVDNEYYITLSKQSDNIETTISLNSYEGQALKKQTISSPITDVNTYSQYIDIYYGGRNVNTSYASDNFVEFGQGFSIGDIYLLDSTGEFLKASSELSWDNGVAIKDKNEYADKTNGALYLYENSELVKIGGSLTKKVYTISADNTSTLDVSSDFTKVVDVLKNGVELAITDDYTISSGVITFVTALSTTDKITVKGE